MADTTVIAVDHPPLTIDDYDSGLSVPPFDTDFFSQGAQGDGQNDAVVDDLDFDFSFDDLYLPSPDELDDLLNPSQIQEFAAHVDQFPVHILGEGCNLGYISSDDAGISNSGSPVLEPHQIPGHLSVPSPESNGSNHETPENCNDDVKVTSWPSPESRGSDICGSNVSKESKNRINRSVDFSPSPNNSMSNETAMANQKAKSEELSKMKIRSSSLKRKKDSENPENSNSSNNNGVLSEEDEKRKARLMRNRESAQLSRQRKKHYVEELEEKVKMMQSTIQDLNTKVAYFMAENTTLRQQMGGNISAPPPGMYPPPSMMMYPWMPCPPYVTKQGSQVPLVPIPRLKPQQPAQAPLKAPKKVENKKGERPTKIKKVASVSFLGILFFFMLFGCLVPIFNVRYGGVRDTLTIGGSYDGVFEEHHNGRVLMMNGTRSRDNVTEPLVASLYVPRNDKLVKIDGNLIIHSVLASERTVSSSEDTAIAVRGGLSHTVRVPELRAIGSGSADRVERKLSATDGKIQQWFQEGLAGPMLSTGMCTEVFQFDVSSASGAIVPAAAATATATATATQNITQGHNRNSTQLTRAAKNRRILRGLPITHSESTHNISKRSSGKKNPHEHGLNGNNTVSPMVVSVLVDPREVGGDADVDGVIKSKSLSRIFVVVLIDSVKYVTYSCGLPFKGSPHHLVTT
ncbi:BZIP transcription factor family protein [Striga asiatica]|uniref:BZIP transcription factor family protein n=1 Tax=Striga asiatica TaxID=4170 RepID=A0A5A7NZJ5_STRAF|nr:BZIP transcription factor family protein [Striga asiatica]